MAPDARAKVHPLQFRPGAQYQCFGDGLCCTDIHALGPLTRRELVQIRRLDRRGGVHDETFDQPMLRTKADGSCTFQMPDRRCGIHARFGFEAKPSGCRRFPLGLVATPAGGRVTTDQRCPCRTVGERPALTGDGVRSALVDDAGRLVADRRVERVSLDRHRRVAFSRFEPIESDMIASMLGGKGLERALGTEPFPRLRGTTWAREAEPFLECDDLGQFGESLGWMGDAVLSLTRGDRPGRRMRPWADSFDRAAARPGRPRTADEVLGDWAADEVWCLRWCDEGWSFDRLRADLATRVAIARHIIGRLRRAGLQEGRAAAEAVTIVEMVGVSDYWNPLVRAMRV